VSTTFDKLLGQLLLHSHSGDDVTSQVGDADTVDGQHAADFASSILINTRANVLATDPATVKIAFAIDYGRFYLSDGTSWYGSPIPFGKPSTGVDIGALVHDDDYGYGIRDLSSKYLHNAIVKGFTEGFMPLEKGAIKFDNNKLQIYNGTQWLNVITLTDAQVSDLMLRSHWIANHTTVAASTDTLNKTVATLGFIDIGALPADVILDGGELL